jgi:hypothetical protein
MAFNKLRRQIEQEQRTSYGEPAEKIAAQSKLLTAALAALGGPVVDNRPQEVTLAAAATLLAAADTFEAALEHQSMRDDIERGTPIVGRDTGDEDGDFNPARFD